MGFKETVIEARDKEIDEAFKAGQREVVEWINKVFSKRITIDLMMATHAWQAYLKEQGID